METPRITGGFSLTSRLGNALALSLQSKGLKTKNLLKQAWQIFFLLIPSCARSLHRGVKRSEVELFWGGFMCLEKIILRKKSGKCENKLRLFLGKNL